MIVNSRVHAHEDFTLIQERTSGIKSSREISRVTCDTRYINLLNFLLSSATAMRYISLQLAL